MNIENLCYGCMREKKIQMKDVPAVVLIMPPTKKQEVPVPCLWEQS